MARRSYLEAIRDAIFEEMARDPNVYVIGGDQRHSVYGTTTGLVEAYGEERVLNTPIAEAGTLGIAIGSSMVGMRPIVDLGIASFIYPAMDQLCSMAAKTRYLYGGQASVPIVIRASMFYGNNTGAQHSDRPYSMFMTMPGLKIMIPSTAYDVKGLLKTAIRDEDPVMSFEDANVWSNKSDIPDEEYLIPFGVADIKRRGMHCTVVGIGKSVHLALEAASELEKDGISLEVIDPRTLAPLDTTTILESLAKTGRLVIADPGHDVCSAAAHIAAVVSDQGFWDLRAPIVRVTTPQTHVPFSPALEPLMYPTRSKIIAAVRRTLN